MAHMLYLLFFKLNIDREVKWQSVALSNKPFCFSRAHSFF